MDPTVVLGLVTHRRTRFPGSSGRSGVVARLGSALARRGVPAEVVIHTDDLHDPSILPLTNGEVRASIDAELALEARWRRYVDPGSPGFRIRSEMTARRAYRRVRLAPPWHRGELATTEGAAMLRRLVNIEYAHLNLMRRALDMGAAWTLIVEDDATLPDAEAFSDALCSFMASVQSQTKPKYVNVSRSFDHSSLGMSTHLTKVGDWSPGIGEWSSDRPLTNTVCAVLYRGSFLRALVPALEAIPVSPVLPIDWKVNAALLDLLGRGALGDGDCWFLNPAPIVQGSMHGSAG